MKAFLAKVVNIRDAIWDMKLAQPHLDIDPKTREDGSNMVDGTWVLLPGSDAVP